MVWLLRWWALGWLAVCCFVYGLFVLRLGLWDWLIGCVVIDLVVDRVRHGLWIVAVVSWLWRRGDLF